jgi:hypothetical protein
MLFEIFIRMKCFEDRNKKYDKSKEISRKIADTFKKFNYRCKGEILTEKMKRFWMKEHTEEVLTFTEVFINQKSKNICEQTVKIILVSGN